MSSDPSSPPQPAEDNPLPAGFYRSDYRNKLPRSNLLGRWLWSIVYRLLFYPTPVACFAWRRMLLRLFGAEIDCTAKIYPSARVWAPWNLRMEKGSAIGPEAYCYNVAAISLDVDATVSFRAFLCTASHDIHHPDRPLVTGPIHLGRGAYVFADAFIGMNVTIHEGGVVAARAVVVKDMPAFAIVAGNPSRVVGSRQHK
jgi:putative colanic acid biosynthesis acetyltransferase WcaF